MLMKDFYNKIGTQLDDMKTLPIDESIAMTKMMDEIYICYTNNLTIEDTIQHLIETFNLTVDGRKLN